MRDLFRLIVVAAMSFAVVGVAMVYSRGDDLGQTLRDLGSRTSSLVAGAGKAIGGAAPEAAEAAAAAPTYTLSLARPNAAQWVGLAGFPDQSELRFPLPAGGHYLSGTLNLSFESQLAENGDGLMTLSVNGTPRGQVVLDSGYAQHQVRLELTPADLAGPYVLLQMSGRGNTNSGQICPTDAANSGSAVSLGADSRLDLVSDQPLTDAAALLAASAQPYVLEGDAGGSDMALVIWAEQELNRAGLQARIGVAGAGETPVVVADQAVSAASVQGGNMLVGRAAVMQLVDAAGADQPLPEAWPVGVAELGAETTLKSFRGSKRWTIPFTIADMPDGGVPEQARLRLKVTPLEGSSDWVLRVSLNGNLLETRRLPGSTDAIALDLALPAERMLASNALLVELVDTTPNEGICARGPDAQAQLLPESVLVDGAPAVDGWPMLVEQLAAAPGIALEAAEGLSVAQANQASQLLAAVLPRDAAVRFDGQAAVQLAITSRAGLAGTLAGLPGNENLMALLPGGSDTAGVMLPGVASVSGADFAKAIDNLQADDVIVLVSGL